MPSFYIDFNPETKVIVLTNDNNTNKKSLLTPHSSNLTPTEDFHHITNVFRHKVGDIIPILNGRGYTAKAEILEIKKKSLTLRLYDINYTKREKRKVACAFSLLKNKHDLLIVEKLTELGVSDLFPMTTKHSVRQSKDNTIDKMIKVAISAIKQCDNAWLPQIHLVQDLPSILDDITKQGYTPIIASEERPENTLTTCPLPLNPCIIIGPEGGFDPNEFALFNQKQIQKVALCKNILRAETAAICAVSQIIGGINE